MDYSQGFKFDEIKVFSQNGRKYCIPMWAFQSDLNLEVSTDGIDPVVIQSFKTWAESRTYPLDCAFELPDGVYLFLIQSF